MELRAQDIPRYTVKDYQQWKGDWELIKGYPYAMSPSAKGRHQLFAFKLARLLADQLDHCPHCQVYLELDWIVAEDTVVRPDIFIHCGEAIEDYLKATPTLIIEILSPATLLKDQGVKKELYASQAVGYYIIADPATGHLQRLQLVDGEYEDMVLKDDQASIELGLDCQVAI